MQLMDETSKEWSTKTTFTLMWEDEITILPNHTLFRDGMVTIGTFDMEYTSTVTLFLKDKTTFSFTDTGRRDAVDYSQVKGSCEQKEGKHDGEDIQPGKKRSVPVGFIG